VGRRVALLVAAIVIAAIGTTLVYLYAKQADDRAQADAQPQDVLVARELIPAGTTAEQAITDNLIETKSIAADDVAVNAVGTVEALSGQVAITTIYQGQQILTDLFGTSVEAVSAIDSLPKGMIATSYEFTDTGRVAGFVNPGSRVSVFVTTNTGTGDQAEPTTRLLLPDVEVLAVANLTVNPPADPTKANPEALPRALMTLALTQEQTEKMKFAVTVGELSLALRNDTSEVTPGPGVDANNLFN
jgi:pilus assembly protein CpaB